MRKEPGKWRCGILIGCIPEKRENLYWENSVGKQFFTEIVSMACVLPFFSCLLLSERGEFYFPVWCQWRAKP